MCWRQKTELNRLRMLDRVETWLDSCQRCKEFDRIYKNVLRILHERQESAGIS